MNKYTCIFFDIDNTLLDFNLAEKTAIKSVLAKHSLPDDDATAKLYSDINQTYWERFERCEIKKEEIFEGRFKTLITVLNSSADSAKMSQDYFESLRNYAFKIDGADDILTYLKSKGYKLYATTNGYALTQYKRIKSSGLEEYFDDIFVSEKIGHQKPSKEYFDRVIELIEEKDRDKMIVIGDSLSSDILGGINSEIDTCWYNPKGNKSEYKIDYTVSSLNELKEIL